MDKLSPVMKAVVAAVLAVLGTVSTAVATKDWTPTIVAAITGVATVFGVYKATNAPAV